LVIPYSTEHFPGNVAPGLHIQKILDLNLNEELSTDDFMWFSSVLSGSSWLPKNGPWPFPSISCTIPYLLFLLPFGTEESDLLAASVSEP